MKGQPIPKDALQSFACSLDGAAQPALTATVLDGSLAPDGTIHRTVTGLNATPGNMVGLTASGLDDLELRDGAGTATGAAPGGFRDDGGQPWGAGGGRTGRAQTTITAASGPAPGLPA